MKNATLKTFTFLLAFVLMVVLLPAVNTNADSSGEHGQCGQNAKWEYCENTLTISGTGITYNYSAVDKPVTDHFATSAPWYKYRAKITKLVIKNGITGIGSFAFQHLYNLTEIVWPTDGKLKQIGPCAFAVTNLSVCNIPKGVTYIGTRAFYGCPLSKVTFPNTLKTIGEAAFAGEGGTKLASLSIPSSVTTIGNYAFYLNENLKSVTGGSGLVSIGSYAFYRCGKLSTFKVTSKKLKTIGAYAFKSCPKLKTIYIQKTTKLTKKTVKNSLKSSSVKTVKVKSSKVSSYKKYFTKSNCGRKVTVKK